MKILSKEQFDNSTIENIEIDGLNTQLAIKNNILPICVNKQLILVTTKSFFIEAYSFASFYSKADIVYVVDNDIFNDILSKFFNNSREDINNGSVLVDDNYFDDPFCILADDILADENAAPIIKFVNTIFYEAIKRRVSDIHIETRENGGEIRFRVDGVLETFITTAPLVTKAIIGRIKVISNLDMTEKRVPQDGRINLTLQGKKLDIRVSTIPSFYGEKVVLRLLFDSDSIPSLESLGFEGGITSILNRLAELPFGMIVVTGPTGSGKTTTLHSILKTLNSKEKNIVSIEDPIEYKASGVTQVQVNEAVGLTFANGLRSILRQDPDTIMIGEMRDEETAQLAIRAALTGHLTLSTLHTNSAVAALSRLRDMKIEEYLIASSLVGILSQRLLRRLCLNCKSEDINPDNIGLLSIQSDTKFYKPLGCEKCRWTGYIGRIAVGEILVIDADIRKYIVENKSESEMIQLLESKGMQFMNDALSSLVASGQTSIDEAKRALFLNG